MKRVIGAVLVLVVLGILGATDPAGAKPAVSWSPRKVQETVVAGGGTLEVPVTAHIKARLENVVAWVTPEIADIVSVVPVLSPPANLSAGDRLELTLVFEAGVEMDPTELEGAVHLRSENGNRTYALPLPVGINVVWPSVTSEEGGFSISYPGEFEESVGSVSELPSGEQTQFASFESLMGDFTLFWVDGYPEGTPISEWANQEEWPTPNGDWRGLYVLTSIGGREVLQDPHTGSTILAVGNKEYHIFNGIGIDPVYVDLDTFNQILESLEFAE